MIKILHNNSCSKSRAILEYLDENNVKFEIIDFIENPFSKTEIKTVLKKLNCTPSEILRKNEEEFKLLNINLEEVSNDELVDILFLHPNLIQRPILIKGKIAMIGRPLENVKYFIEH
jgi:arsenate reductase